MLYWMLSLFVVPPSGSVVLPMAVSRTADSVYSAVNVACRGATVKNNVKVVKVLKLISLLAEAPQVNEAG